MNEEIDETTLSKLLADVRAIENGTYEAPPTTLEDVSAQIVDLDRRMIMMQEKIDEILMILRLSKASVI